MSTSCSQFKYHIVVYGKQQKLWTTYIEIKFASINSTFFPFCKVAATWTMQKKNEDQANEPNKQNGKKKQWQICYPRSWEREQSKRDIHDIWWRLCTKVFQATLRFLQVLKYVCNSCFTKKYIAICLLLFFSGNFQCADAWHNIFTLHHLDR